jgi:sigma-E factor negative regulatory protein RseA
MSEKMRESLSALMDDEANELEMERVLARIGEDEELRRSWVRYHVARDAAVGSVAPSFSQMDISRRVQAAVTQQGGARRSAPAFRQGLARPLGSFAIAASVAAAVVLGGQQFAALTQDNSPAVADNVAPGRVFNMESFSTPYTASLNIGASSATLQSTTPQAYRNLARNRTGRYMQEHAAQAALNSPQGIVPFARVPRIQE